MDKKEKTLSEKELWMHHNKTNQECYCFTKEDVKQFIKDILDEISKIILKSGNTDVVIDMDRIHRFIKLKSGFEDLK